MALLATLIYGGVVPKLGDYTYDKMRVHVPKHWIGTSINPWATKMKTKPLILDGGKLRQMDGIDQFDPSLLGSGAPDDTKVLCGDGVWRVPTQASSASVHSGVTPLDFGPSPGVSELTVTVTGQVGIMAGATIQAWLTSDESTIDHDAHDHLMFGIVARLFPSSPTPAESSFKIVALSSEPLDGTYNVHWSWFNPN